MTVRVTVKLDKAKIGIIEKAQRQGLELAAEATISDIRTSAVVPKILESLKEVVLLMLQR